MQMGFLSTRQKKLRPSSSNPANGSSNNQSEKSKATRRDKATRRFLPNRQIAARAVFALCPTPPTPRFHKGYNAAGGFAKQNRCANFSNGDKSLCTAFFVSHIHKIGAIFFALLFYRFSSPHDIPEIGQQQTG